MNEAEPRSNLPLAAVALFAGTLQLAANVALGLADVGALEEAALEPVRNYLWGFLGIVTGIVATVLLRRRPLAAAIAFLALQAAVLWPLSRHTSWLGFVLRGETVLHHFLAILCAWQCVLLARTWMRDGPPGWRRSILLIPAVGAFGVLGLHVTSLAGPPVQTPDWLHAALVGILLCAPIVACVSLWPRLAPGLQKYALPVLLVPLGIRIAFAFPESLRGAVVEPTHVAPLMSAIVVASLATYVLVRPHTDRWLAFLATVVSASTTAFLHFMYRRAFGELEDGLGGIFRSLFAFSLPYPDYVEPWQAGIVAIALFFMMTTVVRALLSETDRASGIALALLATTGLGLSDPQFVLMLAAALLLLANAGIRIDAASPNSGTATHTSAPPPSVDKFEPTWRAVANHLGIAAPTSLHEKEVQVLVVQGSVRRKDVDLRLRIDARGHGRVHLRVGIIGKDDPEVELVPDDGRGKRRPAHFIARTHHARGNIRALETRDERLLDTLATFPNVCARFWPTGTELVFPGAPEDLDASTLIRLIDALLAQA